MQINLSVTLMTHPERYEKALQVKQRLGSQHHIRMCVDENQEGIWPNARRAWLDYDPSCTHHLVLQDDIRVSRDFLDLAPWVISHLPNPLDAYVSFCSNLHERTYEARRQRHNWMKGNIVRHAQALVQPTQYIDDFVKWADENVRLDYIHDDGRLECYLITHDKQIWYTIPSLIEHDDNGAINSSTSRFVSKKPPYSAYFYIGDERSARDIDWNRGVIGPTQAKLSMPRMIEQWAMGWVEYDNEERAKRASRGE